MTREKAIFAFVIEVMGKEKVGAVLKQVGFAGNPTPELCLKALDKRGKAFAVPFGKLARQAGQSPKAKEVLLQSAKVNKAAGANTAGTSLTAEQKSQQGLDWFNAIAGLIGKGIDSADDLINATNGTTGLYAQAELERQERLRQEASQKNTVYLVLGGIGVLLIVAIFVFALTKRQ